MKIKRKFAYTKGKRMKFTQEQFNAAMEKALIEHPELTLGVTDELKNLGTIKTIVNNG